MDEQRNNGRGIFYGVIGVATLVVAIIGATFAYFTATATNNNVITGNMATISFDLSVRQVSSADTRKGGMIPMSNTMVERAFLTKEGNKKTDAVDLDSDGEADPTICTDDNGNAVCQVYKIVVKNQGSASMFLDGYVSLVGGSGTPADYTYNTFEKVTTEGAINSRFPTMRWAQAFCTENADGQLTGCSTAGYTTTRTTSTGVGFNSNWDSIQLAESAVSDTSGLNTDAIETATADVIGSGVISGNTYDIINKNYIRVSDHAYGSTDYDRDDDATSALVFNQLIAPKTTGNVGDSTDSDLETGEVQVYEDTQVYYIVVWLSENGKNQTAEATEKGSTVANPAALSFFSGNVTFNSAQGSEVTATFTGYTAVQSDNA